MTEPYRDANGETITDGPLTCYVCLVKPVASNRLRCCSRACTIRAADRRRRGLEPADPGYAGNSQVPMRVSRAIADVRAAIRTKHAIKRKAYKDSLRAALLALTNAAVFAQSPPDSTDQTEPKEAR